MIRHVSTTMYMYCHKDTKLVELIQLNSELVILHPHRCSLHSTHLQQVIVTAYMPQLILHIHYISPHLVILHFTTSCYLITRFIPILDSIRHAPRSPTLLDLPLNPPTRIWSLPSSPDIYIE